MFHGIKYLIVSLVFSHLGFWSGNLFLIALFPDLCLLLPFLNRSGYGKSLQDLTSLVALLCTFSMAILSDKVTDQTVQNVISFGFYL